MRTVESLLAWEDQQDGRHEFDGTNIIEVTGESRRHQRLVMNLTIALHDVLDPTRFEVVQQMRMQIPGRVRYPDVAITASPIPGATRTLRDAIVLFEVLSPDTAETDRTIKTSDYALLPSLQRYITLEQDRPAATIRTRTPSGWHETPTTTSIPIPELALDLPFPAIYRRIHFSE